MILSVKNDQKGAIFIMVICLVFIFMVMGVTFVDLLMNDLRGAAAHKKSTTAFYLAEAGVARARYAIKEDPGFRASISGGFDGGVFAASLTDTVDNTVMIVSTGTYNGMRRVVKLEVVLSSWPMFGNLPDRTAYAAQVIERPFNISWAYNTGGSIVSSPVQQGYRLYFGSNDNSVHAINVNTGAYIGEFPTGGDVTATPAVDKDALYVGSLDRNFYAISLVTGGELWRFRDDPASQFHSSAAVSNGIVYVGADNGRLYALNASNGGVVWTYDTGGAIVGSPAVDEDNGVVYIGSFDRAVYALDASSGTLISGWPYITGGQIYSSPAVYKNVIYIGSDDRYVYALNADGTLKWRYRTGGIGRSSPAVDEDELVFIGSDDRIVYCLEYIESLGSVSRVWRANTVGSVRSSPAVCGNMVFVGSDDGMIYAYEKLTGTRRARINTGDVISGSPCIYGGSFYIGSQDNRMYKVSGAFVQSGPYVAVHDSWYDTY